MTGVAASEPLAVEIISATAGYDQRAREPIVEYKLSRASQKLFAEMTEKNVGRKMELRIDGQPVVAAVIREPILWAAAVRSAAVSPNSRPATLPPNCPRGRPGCRRTLSIERLDLSRPGFEFIV